MRVDGQEKMMGIEGGYIVSRLKKHVHPLQGETGDWTPLLQRIGDARFVLLGEASHGTEEFYRARAEITRRLIEEKGFNAVAVEADWPDAYRINRYVQGQGGDATAVDALGDFRRFPSWMWRNTAVQDFVTWLRSHNADGPEGASQVGFYGLDLYSLHASMDAVVNYLDKVDPEAAKRARYRYSCFQHFGEDPANYGYSASFDLGDTCENEVVAQLTELRQKAYDYLHRDGFVAQDEFFFAEQNARIALNAEQYYRTMFHGDVLSWNLRDSHMMDTLVSLASHLEQRVQPAKIVVWEHNSHLGDARATEMSRRGEHNVGQLVRQRWGEAVVSVGFTTYEGAVTAASDWGGPAQRMSVHPALPGSYEWLFHALETPAFLLLFDSAHDALADLNREKLERAIGVVYRPDTERVSHYFNARLMDQFNAVVHFDRTRAVEPLERTSEWERGEAPETFPSGV